MQMSKYHHITTRTGDIPHFVVMIFGGISRNVVMLRYFDIRMLCELKASFLRKILFRMCITRRKSKYK